MPPSIFLNFFSELFTPTFLFLSVLLYSSSFFLHLFFSLSLLPIISATFPFQPSSSSFYFLSPFFLPLLINFLLVTVSLSTFPLLSYSSYFFPFTRLTFIFYIPIPPTMDDVFSAPKSPAIQPFPFTFIFSYTCD